MLHYQVWISFGFCDGSNLCESDSLQVCKDYIDSHRKYFNDVRISLYDTIKKENVLFEVL